MTVHLSEHNGVEQAVRPQFVSQRTLLAEPTRVGSNALRAGLLSVADITRARLRAVAERYGGGLDER